MYLNGYELKPDLNFLFKIARSGTIQYFRHKRESYLPRQYTRTGIFLIVPGMSVFLYITLLSIHLLFLLSFSLSHAPPFYLILFSNTFSYRFDFAFHTCLLLLFSLPAVLLHHLSSSPLSISHISQLILFTSRLTSCSFSLSLSFFFC